MTSRSRSATWTYAAALVAVVAVVVTAWAQRVRTRPVLAGDRAPSFEALDPQGARVALADYAGKVVLLNVWATWCAPCREEMPSMQRLYDMFPRDQFEIAAVSIDAPPGEMDALGNPGSDPVAFARELGLTFPILLDPEGAVERIYRTSGVPESFLIGPDGIVYKKMAGSAVWDSEANVGLVRRLAEARGPAGPSAVHDEIPARSHTARLAARSAAVQLTAARRAGDG